MPGGTYSALSGMQTRLEELDRIAADLANIGTAGYKTQRAGSVAAERNAFARVLDSAVDVMGGETRVDFRTGTIATTGRTLDVAIQGKGFIAIDTPAGVRYTRNGSLTRGADGTLMTSQGEPIANDSGTGPIKLTAGEVAIDGDGTVRVGGSVAGKIRVVQFASGDDLVRESGSRFRAIAGATPTPAEGGTLVAGSLEQSNASAVDLMSKLTEVSRSFETLQRGISMINNDLDARAITELARR
jgi:flagellar basal-body rod protein FlgF